MLYRQGFALMVALGLGATTAAADDLGEAAREVVEANGEALVTVKLVLKSQMSFGGFSGDDSESVHEVLGTVISEDGLIVTSLTNTNPLHLMEDLMSSMGSAMGTADMELEMGSSIEGLTILLKDGREIKGKIVLRDRDLDLAFVRAEEALPDYVASVNLDAEPEVNAYDPLIVPSRLGRVANRIVTAEFPRVSGILERPRLLYVIGDQFFTHYGTPAFTVDGDCVGISVIRKIPFTGSGGGLGAMMMNPQEMMTNIAAVVVPGKDVLEIAQQAPAYDAVQEEISEEDGEDDEG